MKDPIITLLELNFTTLQLDEAQALIDKARPTFTHDQYFQLNLDRHQAEIDAKRIAIAQLMADIRNRN